MEIILPMLATIGSLPKNPEDYAFEIKWDGLRALLYYENKQVQILSRNNNNITNQYPELIAIKEALGTNKVILDGEIVYLAENGHPSFSGLQHRMGVTSPKKVAALTSQYPVTYIIFDVLYLNNKNLTALPYVKRREILTGLTLLGESYQVPPFTVGNGSDMLTATRRLKIEGIIAKRLNSPYLPGKRSNDWLKIKNKLRQEFVIGGWLPGQKSRLGSIGSLLIGYYDMPSHALKDNIHKQKLIYAGKAGTGFTAQTLKDLGLKLSSLQRQTSPFANKTPKNAVFVEPNLVGEFEFTEWTPHNTLRHPAFKGLRDDKKPCDVIKED